MDEKVKLLQPETDECVTCEEADAGLCVRTVEERIPVTILSMGGDLLAALELAPLDTLAVVREKLAAHLDGSCSGRLVSGDRVLSYAQTVAEVGLVPGAALYLVKDHLPTFHLCTDNAELLEGGRKAQVRQGCAGVWGWAFVCAPPSHRSVGFRLGQTAGAAANDTDYWFGVFPAAHFQLASNQNQFSGRGLETLIASTHSAFSSKAGHSNGNIFDEQIYFSPGDIIVVEFDPNSTPGGQVRFGYKGLWSKGFDTDLRETDDVCLAASMYCRADGFIRSIEICRPNNAELV